MSGQLPTGFTCDYSSIEPLLIQSISWIKDGKLIDSKALDTSLADAGRRLNFKSALTNAHEGIYRCDVNLRGNDYVYQSFSYIILME